MAARPRRKISVQDKWTTAQISFIVIRPTVAPIDEKPLVDREVLRNPYRGLHKFTEEDADFFFGRNEAVENLLNTIQSLVETEPSIQAPNLIAVIGSSGSGKSSLVRAGLIPALRAGRLVGSDQWLINITSPGSRPLDALVETFAGQLDRGLETLRSELDGDEKALYDLIVEALAEKPSSAVYVLIIDPFEEIFTLCEDETERRLFIDQILYASQIRNSRGLVILTMRANFYTQVGTYQPLAEAITGHQILLSPMTERELREAILLPAEAVGLEIEKELVQSLIDVSINQPGSLPLLQHALAELFERRDGNLLSMSAYQEIGGIRGAIAQRAESTFASLTSEQQQLTRHIFLSLIQGGEDAGDTPYQASLEEIKLSAGEAEKVEPVLHSLANANLLAISFDPESGQVIVEIALYALVSEWRRLRAWLDEEQLWAQLSELKDDIHRIEIEKKVAEIVDTDFFRDLQARAREIRDRRRRLQMKKDAEQRERQVAEIVDTDFFRDLQARASELRNRRRRGEEAKDEEQPEREVTEFGDSGYIRDLQARASELRNRFRRRREG